MIERYFQGTNERVNNSIMGKSGRVDASRGAHVAAVPEATKGNDQKRYRLFNDILKQMCGIQRMRTWALISENTNPLETCHI